MHVRTAAAWLVRLLLLLLVASAEQQEGCVELKRAGGGRNHDDPSLRVRWLAGDGRVHFDVELRLQDGTQERVLGYVAVGISDPDAGIFTGGPSDLWLVRPGNATAAGEVVDAHFSMMKIRRDASQDLSDVRVSVSDDGKVISGHFSRAFATGDSSDVAITQSRRYQLLYAYRYEPTHDGLGGMRPADMGVHSDEVDFFLQGGSSLTCSEDAPLAAPRQVATSSSSDASCTPKGSYNKPGKILVEWSLASDGETMDFVITGKTLGWVSIGFSDRCSMKNADKIVGWVDDSSKRVTALDTWSTGKDTPDPDESRGGSNDLINPTGSQNSTHTVLRFSRKLATNDNNDWEITNSEITLMWAIASRDGSSATHYPEHNAYGCTQVNMLGGCAAPTSASHPAASSGTTTDCATDNVTGAWEDSHGRFALLWSVNGNLTDITFTMTAKTLGWLSIGFNDKLLMDGSDEIVGWVSNGAITLIDTSSSGHSIPDLDTALGGTDDLYNVTGWENATHTQITFCRKLDTGDSHDWQIKNEQIYLIWAWASADGTSPDDYPEHGGTSNLAYGGVKVNFLSCAPVVYVTHHGFFLKNAGQALAFTVACLLVLAALLHWCRRAAGWAVPYDPIPAVDKSGVSMQGSQLHLAPEGGDAQDIELEEVHASPTDAFVPDTTPHKCGHFVSCFVSVLSAPFCWRVKGGAWPVWSVAIALAYALLNIGWAVVWCKRWPQSDPKPVKLSEVIARTLGNLVSANMLIAVLPATRNSLLVVLLGESFERTVMFHRWVGRWTFVLLLGHTAAFFAAWKREVLVENGKPIKDQCYALGGLFCCIAMALTSLSVVRRKLFNFFYWSHLLFMVPFFTMAALHNDKFLPFAYAAAAIYVADRVFRLVWGTVPRRATEVALLADGVVRIRWPKHPLARYYSGQYVFLNFPQLNILEWHPFTLANSPREHWCEVDVKSLGNSTAALLKRAPSKGALWVRADGPYGHFSVPFKRYPVLVLVAGGIGVTPMISVLRGIFGAENADGSEAKPRWGKVQVVYFFWGIRSIEQYTVFQLRIEYCKRKSLALAKAPALRLRIAVSQPHKDATETAEEISTGASPAEEITAERSPSSDTSGTPVSQLEEAAVSPTSESKKSPSECTTLAAEYNLEPTELSTGRLDIKKELGTIAEQHPGAAVAVCVCGPEPLVNSVWDKCTALKRQGHTFDLHRETFNL
eukprot:TRINITY_DN4392_c0_g1_i2.p1 TRINITY_DN4392_c0_g1~~TRINITY_DN4392_c0_g1_i2.p1  ORF type:complete len:1205 (-),score=276.71 TRINITY_DN4392_c0_g1_i2:2925-6539(-)